MAHCSGTSITDIEEVNTGWDFIIRNKSRKEPPNNISVKLRKPYVKKSKPLYEEIWCATKSRICMSCLIRFFDEIERVSGPLHSKSRLLHGLLTILCYSIWSVSLNSKILIKNFVSDKKSNEMLWNWENMKVKPCPWFS